MKSMNRYRLSLTEKMILGLVLLMIIVGYVIYFQSVSNFLKYVQEDGVVEWFTVLGLILGFFVCMKRFFTLLKKRNWWFLTVTFLLGIMQFFAAGEEISWGQRIFHIHSSAYFEKNNAQHETNFHNLVVDGEKLNIIIFTIGLGVAMGLYLLVLPIVYRKSVPIKKFLDRSAVPIPQVYQVISFVLLGILVSLIPNSKNAEMLECGATLLFFLIVRYPFNPQIFDRNKRIAELHQGL